jgi:putative transposase
MARRKYKAEEIIQHLRTAEIEQHKGATLEEAAKKIGVCMQTLIRWKNEYGGLGLEQAKRLKELEHENSKLKRLVADQALDNLILKEAARGNF